MSARVLLEKLIAEERYVFEPFSEALVKVPTALQH